MDRDQTRAASKSTITDARHAVGDCDGSQARAASKSTITDACYLITNYDLFDRGQATEPTTYFLAMKFYGGQTCTVFKSFTSDARHATTDYYRGKTAAIFESRFPNGCYIVGDGQ